MGQGPSSASVGALSTSAEYPWGNFGPPGPPPPSVGPHNLGPVVKVQSARNVPSSNSGGPVPVPPGTRTGARVWDGAVRLGGGPWW